MGLGLGFRVRVKVSGEGRAEKMAVCVLHRCPESRRRAVSS